MLFSTLFFLPEAVQNAEFTALHIIIFGSMILGLVGYVGLLILFKGLHQTNHLRKLTLLLCGVLGQVLFMIFVSPRDFADWIFETDIESLVGKWPSLVSLYFSVMIGVDKYKALKAF